MQNNVFSKIQKKITKKSIALAIVAIFLITISIVMVVGNQPEKATPNPNWVASVTSTDIIRQSFFIQSGKLDLEADLLIPVGGNNIKPAIIFLGGSGSSIYQNYAPEFLEKFIQGVFLPNDFAVLYFNKRGMGESEGNWMHNDIQGRADDAYAAVQYLKNHPSIDSNNIGLVGHSQGGWVASLAASQHDDIAFFISLNGPTTTVEEQIEDTWRWDYQSQGYEGEELEKKVRKGLNSNRFWSKVGKVVRIGPIAFMYNIFDYDPRDAIGNITIPGLFVFSEYDGLVPVAHNLERFDEIFNGSPPSNLNTTVISEANHSFRIIDNLFDLVNYYDTSIPQSEELVNVLNNYLTYLGY